MKKSRLLGAVCACVFAVVISIPAGAAVIDFEGFLPEGSAYVASPQDWDGYRFESSSAGFGTYTDSYSNPGFVLPKNGTTRMGVFDYTVANVPDELTITQIAGGGFYLNSFDAVFANTPLAPNTALDIFITTVAGPIFQHHYSINTDWTTIILPTYTLEMHSVLIRQTGSNLYGFALDNVTINAVPIPAAAWLFGSGLVGLVAMARRKRRHE